MGFPTVRMRRLRKTSAMRDMLNQVCLRPSKLIYPIFVDENIKKPVPIDAMPGYSRLPISQLVTEGKQALAQGVKSVILFGIPAKKDEAGTSAFAKEGIVQLAARELKNRRQPAPRGRARRSAWLRRREREPSDERSTFADTWRLRSNWLARSSARPARISRVGLTALKGPSTARWLGGKCLHELREILASCKAQQSLPVDVDGQRCLRPAGLCPSDGLDAGSGPGGNSGIPGGGEGATPLRARRKRSGGVCGAIFEGTTIRYVVKESTVTGWPVRTSTRDTWSG